MHRSQVPAALRSSAGLIGDATMTLGTSEPNHRTFHELADGVEQVLAAVVRFNEVLATQVASYGTDQDSDPDDPHLVELLCSAANQSQAVDAAVNTATQAASDLKTTLAHVALRDYGGLTGVPTADTALPRER